MKRFSLLLVFVALALALFACSEPNITFLATVEEVTEGGLLVTVTGGDPGFDRAFVSLGDVEPDFAISPGDQLELEVLPLVAESYPVQVTAAAIRPQRP